MKKKFMRTLWKITLLCIFLSGTNFIKAFASSSGLKQAAILIKEGAKNQNGIYIGLTGYQADAPIYLDFGDGVLQEFLVKKGPMGQTAIQCEMLKSDTVKIYGNPMSVIITAQGITEASFFSDSIQVLNIANNLIKSLDVEACTGLQRLFCQGNALHMKSLPSKQTSWLAYQYAPQAEIKILDSIEIWKEVKLNEMALESTEIKWFSSNHTELVSGKDYLKSENGIKFIQLVDTLIYAVFSDENFPDFKDAQSLKTNHCLLLMENFEEQAHLISIETNSKDSLFSFKIKAKEDYSILQIDRGDGQRISFRVSGEKEINDSLLGNVIKIYGTNFSSLSINNMQARSLEFGRNENIKILDCSNNELATLDVSKFLSLTSLNCSENLIPMYLLPEKANSWEEYFYAPQATFDLSNQSIENKIDLSDFENLKGVSTQTKDTEYKWYTQTNTLLVENKDFTKEQGLFSFKGTTGDSVYCIISTDAFPDFTNEKKYKTSLYPIKKTAIETDVNSKINYYTNGNTLFIENYEAKKIYITDISGRIFRQYSSVKEDFSCHLPSGFYIVVLEKESFKIFIP